MKRAALRFLGLSITLAALVPSVIYAGTIPGVKNDSHSTYTNQTQSSSGNKDPTSSSKSANTDGNSRGPIDGYIYGPRGPAKVELDGDFDIHLTTDISVYKPKVTLVHNINALCAQYDAVGNDANNPVYYIPTTESLPFDVKKYVQTSVPSSLATLDPTDSNFAKTHQFSHVYDGYYDAEAAVDNAMITQDAATDNDSDSTSYVSQSVSTKNVANPAVKSIGYDILLSKESFHVKSINGGKDLEFTNESVPVTRVYKESDEDISEINTALNYQTIIMDIYKALGQFEYYITTAFIQDKNWEANSSPILSEISLLTTADDEDGFDISESYCGLAVSRTNPELYMNRFRKDGIAHGVPESSVNASEILHSGESLDDDQEVTFAEFCRVLVPLMNLYGEDTISDADLTYAEQVYSQDIAFIDNLQTSDKNLLIWMLAKGLIDSDQLRQLVWDAPISLLEQDVNESYPGNYIIDILGRVADPDRRIKYSLSSNIDTILANKGFGELSVTLNDTLEGYTERSSNTYAVYDYFVEYSKATKYKIVVNASKNKKDIQVDKNSDVTGSASTTGATVSNSENNKKTSTSNIRLFDSGGNVIKMAAADFYKELSPDKKNFDKNTQKLYHYYGVKKYNGKKYYHFKITPELAKTNFKIGYYLSKKDKKTIRVTKNEWLKPNNNFIVLSSNQSEGGIYNIHLKTSSGHEQVIQEHFTLDDYNMSDSFTDAVTYQRYAGYLANDLTTLIIYKKISKNSDFKNEGDLKWNNLISSQGTIIKGEPVMVAGGASFTSVYIQPDPATKSDKKSKVTLRMEITTNDPDLVKNSKFITNLKDAEEKVYSTTGYYRYNRNGGSSDLMISYSYLQKNKMATGLTQSSDSKDIWIMTVGDFGSNVILNQDDNQPWIIAGETMYVLPAGTTLVHTIDGEKYINYRACIGWSKDFALADIGDTDGASVCVVPYSEYLIGDKDFEQTLEKVQLPFSNGHSVGVVYNKLNLKKDNVEFEGIPLTTTYALSPYLVVVDERNASTFSETHLFVFHRTKMVTSDGEKHTIKKKNDKNYKKLLQKLTGIKFSVKKADSKEYRLKHYKLDTDNDSGQNPEGIVCVKSTVGTGAGERTASAGFWWKPPEYDVSSKKATEALDDYAKMGNGCVLPIVNIKVSDSSSKLIDVNVNVCAKSDGDKYQPVGTLPCYYMSYTPSQTKTWSKMDDSGNVKLNKASKDTSDYVTYTAPVSIFAQIKGLGVKDLNQITDGSIYFGTTICDFKNDKILLNGHETGFDKEDKAVCTYLGSGNSTTYALTLGGTSVGNVLSAMNEAIKYVATNPGQLVDWSQYKFHRLIMNMDAWSTVVLIFILNILPRVCLALFFLLMILSLIKDVKLWQIFCNRVFDIYSFLSFGRYTVETIDMRQTVTTSLICSSIFIVIMDGQLFNFIIWICKFFIALYQR